MYDAVHIARKMSGFFGLHGSVAKDLLRWGSPENPMKSAYLVAQGYANFCKMVLMVIIHFVLDPESRDVSNCHPYQSPDYETSVDLWSDTIAMV